jgi:hypothetical protein
VPAIVEHAPFAPPIANLRERRTRRGSFNDRGKRLEIGLVNNMPDAAVASTERQFARLIEEASGEFDVRLRLFGLETLPRASEARRDMAARYRDARDLGAGPQDALIVTGAEPRASELPLEPYWRELTFVLDWAETHTISTLLSCLAAHAAVLHRDGIVRRKLPAKRSGVYPIEVAARHELMTAFEPQFVTPHSRHNDLDETDLVAKGYAILARHGSEQPYGLPAGAPRIRRRHAGARISARHAALSERRGVGAASAARALLSAADRRRCRRIRDARGFGRGSRTRRRISARRDGDRRDAVAGGWRPPRAQLARDNRAAQGGPRRRLVCDGAVGRLEGRRQWTV